MSWVENILRQFRFVRRLEREVRDLSVQNTQLRAESTEWKKFSPPGHFYSPLPSPAEAAEAYSRGGFGPPFAAVDLNEAGQLALLESLAASYGDQPFPENPQPGRRFYLNNPSYGAYDAIILQGMLRHIRPRRIIEVGSGYSSAAMLDLNEHCFGGRLELTFIDPDMSRLRSLLRADDQGRVNLIECKVQDVPLDLFARLEAGDVLFIDSSHVSKIGSDVNRLYFDVLPALPAGVWVHIHDVAGNFEYPREWLEEGRAWNEQYLLRAFLMYNRAFEVALSSGWLFNTRHAFLAEHMPLCVQGGGGQLWLRKL